MSKQIYLTGSQSKLMADFDSKATAFVTGYGGGKSFVLCQKMIILKQMYPQCDLLYLFPIYSMHRDILFPTLLEITEGTDIKYQINKTTGEIFFECGGRVILKSMDNPETLVGFNVLAVLLDELDTLPTQKARLVWQKAIARARKKVHKVDINNNKLYNEEGEPIYARNQLFVGTTPEGYRFIYDMFKKKKPENYTLIQASGRENVYLQEDYYDNLFQIYPPELVEAYIEGKFVNMSVGTVYTEFHRETCHTDAIYREGEELHISMDFNVMNMNAVVYAERETLYTGNKNYPYEGRKTLHGIAHLKGIKDTPEMIEVIRNRYPTSPVYVYPDASGKNTSSKGFTTSDISLLKKAGFHCKYPSKNPRIMDRVQSSNSAFKVGLVKINTVLCPDVSDSLEQQTYNENTELPEKSSQNSIDDINDSATYIIHYKFPIKRKTGKTTKVRGF